MFTGTLILDFDSTLIDRESLDELLSRLLAERPDLASQVRAITAAGMEGKITFRESLERRLDLARPRRSQAEALGREATRWITFGMEALVSAHAGSVWLVSGGLVEVVLPVAERLAVPPERVLATHARWSPIGEMLGFECKDKSEQIRPRRGEMPRPVVLAGDGMTDHEPLRAGVVDHFVAFTGVVRRDAVVATGAPVADSAAALARVLAGLR